MSPATTAPLALRTESARTWQGPYVRYVAGRGVSTAGSNLVNVVTAFAVLTAGGSGFAAGLVLGCSVASQTLLLPLSGVLADRLNRRKLAVTGNLALAAVQAVLGTLLIARPDRTPLGVFALAAALTGAATAVVQPAFQGLIVELVPAVLLQKANASLRLVLNLARIAVPGIGSLCGAAFGYGHVLLAGALAFASCSLIMLRLPVRPLPRPASTVAHGWREGWDAFRARTWMWGYALAGALTIPLWLAGYQLLGPLILSRQTGGAALWAWAVCAFSCGMVAGSAVALRWSPGRPMLACVTIQLVWPLPLAVLATTPRLPVLLASIVLSGTSLELAVVFFETARQQHVPEHLIGRVTALAQIGESALIPFGYVLAGTVADGAGAARVMGLCALGILLTTLSLLCSSSVRTLPALPAGPDASKEPHNRRGRG
ncbi:MFS transporter [Streptomyces sp. NPDC048111]|uniref:MFS transporter n=1 Tax=Streptomyces sp. NPDC048111 TaxID=3365500 RepID=UPI0037189D7D